MEALVVITILLLAFIPGIQSCTDQSTLRACATKGEAKMSGGGTIKCEVVREKKERSDD